MPPKQEACEGVHVALTHPIPTAKTNHTFMGRSRPLLEAWRHTPKSALPSKSG
jgi:hypothetical protein